MLLSVLSKMLNASEDPGLEIIQMLGVLQEGLLVRCRYDWKNSRDKLHRVVRCMECIIWLRGRMREPYAAVLLIVFRNFASEFVKKRSAVIRTWKTDLQFPNATEEVSYRSGTRD